VSRWSAAYNNYEHSRCDNNASDPGIPADLFIFCGACSIIWADKSRDKNIDLSRVPNTRVTERNLFLDYRINLHEVYRTLGAAIGHRTDSRERRICIVRDPIRPFRDVKSKKIKIINVDV